MTKQTTTQLVAMAAVAAFMFWRGHTTLAAVLGVMMLIVLTLSLVAPSVLHTFQEMVDKLGGLIGSGLGLISLTIVYYLVFFPGAVLNRLFGSDPLERRFPQPGKSNWVHRVGYGADPGIYAKLFTRPHGNTDSRGSS
jgi:hypothetical protein